MGQLIPTLVLECLPSDRFRLGMEAIARFAPLVGPMQHRVDVYHHYFFVPCRLLWENWEDFITNTPNDGGFISSPPTVTMGTATYTPLCDYMGIPRPPETGEVLEQVSAMPFAAYQFIWNEYYRDQNLMEETDYKLSDGDNTAITNLRQIKNRSWEHDYFTSALPFAQKGGTVEIPLAGFNDLQVLRNTPVIVNGTDITVAVGPTPLEIPNISTDAPDIPDDALYVDSSNLTINNTSITDLRRAFKLQEWLEKSARGGSRYSETIRNFFNLRPQDARLDRPEYITGTKSPVVISEVLNTTGTEARPQGDMAGHGVSITQGRGNSYFCQEHGFIIGIMSIMPKTAYFQGIDRMWLKREPFDYMFPQFQNIGEQPIENRELYAYTALGGDTFGYIPRYAEYKYKPNRVAGDYRTSLNFMHMAREFNSLPTLTGDFIASDPTSRVFAVQDEEVQKMWVQILHKISARRPLSKYSNPSF